MDDKQLPTEKQAATPDEQKAPEQKHEHEKKHEQKHEAHEKKCECLALTDKCLRLAAEFDNYKKRTAKEKEALALHSEAKLMLRLLPVYEEIGLAEQGVAKIADKHVREGALLVLDKLRKSFEAEGMQPMKLEGEKLDPFRHEVALREDSGAPEGTIVRVIKQGYLYKGEVLQHAIVSVSSGTKPEAKGEDAKEVGE